MARKKPEPDIDDVAEVIGDGGILNRLNYALENIVGEVGDDMLADMKAARNLKPWELLQEEAQRALIEQAKARAGALVERVVDALAIRGFPHYVAQVGGYAGKMGSRTVKLTVEVPAENFDPERLSGSAFLVFASAADYGREMKARPQPNQPALMEDGSEIDLTTGEVTGGPAPAAEPEPAAASPSA